MRRTEKQATDAQAWSIFAASPTIHLAAVLPNGEPLLRPLHAIVHDGSLYIHSAPDGEKLGAIGGSVVVMAHEVLAEVPSHFTHASRACPATTFYRSASAHGTLEPIDDLEVKAAVLQALMERYQPQGGHRPILHDDPMYSASVRGVLVLRLRIDRIACKMALGQGKRSNQRARYIQGFWARGAPGDVAAAQAVLDANPMTTPEFMKGPSETRLVLAGGPAHVDGAVALLRDEYWNTGIGDEALAKAQLGSEVWMLVVDNDDAVIATCRALSDGEKTSYVADMAVQDAWRGRGVGRFLLERLLEHPSIRRTRTLLLTVDAGPFYMRLGFQKGNSLPFGFSR